MNVDLRNNRIETVVPVVVTFDENKLAVQPLFELPVFLYSTFFPAFEDKIAQKEDRIVRLNSFVLPFDDRFMVRLRSP